MEGTVPPVSVRPEDVKTSNRKIRKCGYYPRSLQNPVEVLAILLYNLQQYLSLPFGIKASSWKSSLISPLGSPSE